MEEHPCTCGHSYRKHLVKGELVRCKRNPKCRCSGYKPDTKEVPLTWNWGKRIGTATVSDDGTVTAVIDEDAPESIKEMLGFKPKPGEFSIGQ